MGVDHSDGGGRAVLEKSKYPQGAVCVTTGDIRAYRTRSLVDDLPQDRPLNKREGMHTVLKEICEEHNLVLSREAPHVPEQFVVWELLHEDKRDSDPLVRVRLCVREKERKFFGLTQHDNTFATLLAEKIRERYFITGRKGEYRYLGDLPY